MNLWPCTIVLLLTAAPSEADLGFEAIAKRYIDEYPALSPVDATTLGDHRFDGQLDQVSLAARKKSADFGRRFLKKLQSVNRGRLSRANQVDYLLLEHELRKRIWRVEKLREWRWNPLVYTELAGAAIYGLMAREFAPLPRRLNRVADRLEQFPRLFKQIRGTLEPRRVPRIHAETAVKQNRGVLSILRNMVEPRLGKLTKRDRIRLQRVIKSARVAVEQQQKWLENEVLAKAGGNFRLGSARYDEKLRFTLHTPLTRDQIRLRAESELKRVRGDMYTIAKGVYRRKYPYTRFPKNPASGYRQAIIRAALEEAYIQRPPAGGIVAAAKKSLRETTEFVRKHDLITIPPDPVEIIVMPEFQRGISLAYCDSPGPLDVGQKTFYAVAPLPKSWTTRQVDSFLREYNTRSIHNLTIHEAMPGHFVQLSHSNRYPGKLRAVLSSGVFIEGWAVYTEQMMVEAGFLNRDPLMKLIVLKWYLRGIANAILDQAIHCDGISRDPAMRLMMEGTFQEEREAAAKWVRAQLTSTQLSTYFVGYLEHVDLRKQAEQQWKQKFRLKSYHDKVLSFGSPPVKYAGDLLLGRKIR